MSMYEMKKTLIEANLWKDNMSIEEVLQTFQIIRQTKTSVNDEIKNSTLTETQKSLIETMEDESNTIPYLEIEQVDNRKDKVEDKLSKVNENSPNLLSEELVNQDFQDANEFEFGFNDMLEFTGSMLDIITRTSKYVPFQNTDKFLQAGLTEKAKIVYRAFVSKLKTKIARCFFNPAPMPKQINLLDSRDKNLHVNSEEVSTSPCNAVPLSVCETHREPHRLFCQTCIAPACTECLMEEHCGHQLTYIEEAVDSAKGTNRKLCAEARNAIMVVREAIDNVQRMSENVERRSIQAATEVRSIMRRYISALEQREIELLKRIDQTRQTRGKLLMTQMENLRVALSKLARTSDILNESLDSTNAYELIAVNEKAASELKFICSLRPELLPCEDDGIMFLPPDNGFLRAISSIGNVTISSPPLSSRVVRPPPLIKDQPIFAVQREVKEDDLSHTLRNRPIYGANPVRIKNTGPRPSLIFGTEGEKDGQLCRPWGVCCDRLGNIIVADRSNNRIEIFSPFGKFLFKFGKQGSAPGQFDRPAGIALNPQGNIVVADKDNHRIQIFKTDGTFIRTFGEKGNRNGQFNYPWDVACNSLGNIVVSDTRNHRIQLFTAEGKFLNKYGFEGSSTMWKHFDSPRGVCFTPKGNVIVTDFNNHRLVVVDQHFLQAQFLGQEGSSYKQFLRPQGVVCDDDGNIVVADSRNNRIQVFENNGNFLWKVGLVGNKPGELDRPSGICLNPEGRIVVVDFGNNRIQVF